MLLIKHERTTKYKNYSRDISRFRGCSPIQLLWNLTGKCHAIGYYSYTITLALIPKKINEEFNHIISWTNFLWD